MLQAARGRRQEANRLTGNCQLTVSASASASAIATTATATAKATDTRRRHYAKPAKRQIKNANAVSHRGRWKAEGRFLRKRDSAFIELSSLHPIIKGNCWQRQSSKWYKKFQKKFMKNKYKNNKHNIVWNSKRFILKAILASNKIN